MNMNKRRLHTAPIRTISVKLPVNVKRGIKICKSESQTRYNTLISNLEIIRDILRARVKATFVMKKEMQEIHLKN